MTKILIFLLLLSALHTHAESIPGITPTAKNSNSASISSITDQDFSFKVYLDNRYIGQHQVQVQTVGDTVKVAINADFKVKILFFTAFRYDHEVHEVWKDGCLQSIIAKTDNNGEDLFLDGNGNQSKFVLRSHHGMEKINQCVRSFAYWHKPFMASDYLLNMQTALYEPSQFTHIGREMRVMNELSIIADKYLLVADGKKISLWYTPEGEWVSLESETDDGYIISYYKE